MIKVDGSTLKGQMADYFLYCRYTPSISKGDCTKESCKFNKDAYRQFAKRVKDWDIHNGIIFHPIPIYAFEFIGKREINFRYGTIFISDSLESERDKDYSFLKNKRLYLQFYKNAEGKGKVALMVKGNQKRSNE